MSHYNRNYENVTLEKIFAKKILSVEGLHEGSEEVKFITEDYTYIMYHEQDCCESVYLLDICGDESDLIGGFVVGYEESSSDYAPEDISEDSYYTDESQTWTFYKLDTSKGSVVLRWYGSSNGYYSEEVSFIRVANKDKD